MKLQTCFVLLFLLSMKVIAQGKYFPGYDDDGNREPFNVLGLLVLIVIIAVIWFIRNLFNNHLKTVKERKEERRRVEAIDYTLLDSFIKKFPMMSTMIGIGRKQWSRERYYRLVERMNIDDFHYLDELDKRVKIDFYYLNNPGVLLEIDDEILRDVLIGAIQKGIIVTDDLSYSIDFNDHNYIYKKLQVYFIQWYKTESYYS